MRWWHAGLGQYGKLLEHVLYHLCYVKVSCALCGKGTQAGYESVWYYTWRKGEKLGNIGEEKRRIIKKDIIFVQSAYKSSPSRLCLSPCLAHTGDTANVLSRFLCGVNILAQGSDLRGHGVLVMPPRLTVPVCPQSVCKQIKRRGLFN